MIVVSDTSPITALLTIQRIDLLRQLYGEALGREAARHEHLPIIGLMGVLLIAKKKGLVASLRDLIERLEAEAGFYLSRQVKEKVLAVAGE